jgi:hypothetical protein
MTEWVVGTFGALHLIANGAIMVLLGNLCGIPFGRAIANRKDESVVRAWRVAHSGNIMTGVSIMAAGVSVPFLGGSPAIVSAMTLALIVSGYAFTVSLPLGAVVGRRGLAPHGPFSNRLVFAGNSIGSLGTFVGWGLFVWLALAALIGKASV